MQIKLLTSVQYFFKPNPTHPRHTPRNLHQLGLLQMTHILTRIQLLQQILIQQFISLQLDTLPRRELATLTLPLYYLLLLLSLMISPFPPQPWLPISSAAIIIIVILWWIEVSSIAWRCQSLSMRRVAAAIVEVFIFQ